MPGDGPALLSRPDIELFSVIGVMCETIDNKTNERKFDTQTRHAADSQNCSTNRDSQTKLDVDNVSRDKTNTPGYPNISTNKILKSDYFPSSDNKEAGKEIVKQSQT